MILPLVAVGLLVFAVGHALYIQRPEPETPPPVPPPTSPFGHTVAGAGMVEPTPRPAAPATIAVGSQLAGVVTKVWVRIGQEVKAGDLLFELDNRQAEADLKVREAALSWPRRSCGSWNSSRGPRRCRSARRRSRSAEANLRQAAGPVRTRPEDWSATGPSPSRTCVTSEQTYQSVRAQLALAKANLALLKAGAWEPDKAIAAATVEQAQAQVEQAKTTLDLLQVRAPVDGTILQVNVRPGEYVSTSSGQSLILMGNLQPLHVRVNVDEEDLPRLKLNAPARAKIRGDAAQEEVPLSFVRLEPYVVPKTSLTGINTERVDTRVVQLIYAIDPENPLVREQQDPGRPAGGRVHRQQPRRSAREESG